MQKWEYLVVELTSELESEKRRIEGLPTRWFKPPHLTDLLNKHGSEGWELVSFETAVVESEKDFAVLAVFKRLKK
ncbi:MAG: DUF4177 domain-containing protein [Candidatus Bathyarchaeota archaeon]